MEPWVSKICSYTSGIWSWVGMLKGMGHRNAPIVKLVKTLLNLIFLVCILRLQETKYSGLSWQVDLLDDIKFRSR